MACLGLRVASWLESPEEKGGIFMDASGTPPRSMPRRQPMPQTATGVYLTSEGVKGRRRLVNPRPLVHPHRPHRQTTPSIAILDHPEDPGYPTYWHARGYGLVCRQPARPQHLRSQATRPQPSPWRRHARQRQPEVDVVQQQERATSAHSSSNSSRNGHNLEKLSARSGRMEERSGKSRRARTGISIAAVTISNMTNASLALGSGEKQLFNLRQICQRPHIKSQVHDLQQNEQSVCTTRCEAFGSSSGVARILETKFGSQAPPESSLAACALCWLRRRRGRELGVRRPAIFT
jgi:hypothetical protein